MANIKPFKALRPQPSIAKQLASLPYDVLSSAEARKEAQGNPYTFLHITKSEIDLSDKIDTHSPEVYEQARHSLNNFILRDLLFKEVKDCYYIYQLLMNGRTQTGLVCVSSVDDYENDVIKKHEFTRPEKELDRITHIQTTGAQTGNVFLAYRNNPKVDAIIDNWKATKNTAYDFTADDGIQHTIWIVNDNVTISEITRLFAAEVPCTYIADGHHRAASAAKVRKALGLKAAPEADYFLTTLFPSNQLYIMDYNRVVKDLNGLSVADFLAALEKSFELTLKGKQTFHTDTLHTIGLYIDGNWYSLKAKEGTYITDPIGVLDVSILQAQILDPILGIKDQRTDKRIDFVGGIRGLQALEDIVNSGEMACAFSLYPVTIDQLFTIADSGNVMPPKSTWFEPKLRDGLITNMIV